MDSLFTLTATKNVRVEIFQYLIEQVANGTDYLNDVITIDKMWTYCWSMYSLVTKCPERNQTNRVHTNKQNKQVSCLFDVFVDLLSQN